jgi:phosphate-selective porin
VGLDVSWALSSGERIRFRSRPESFFAPYAVDTGDIDGRQAAIAGLEAAWVRDRLSVQGEYMQAEVFRDGLSDPHFEGL